VAAGRLFPALVAATLTTPSFAASPDADALPSWAPQPPPRAIEDRFKVEVSLLSASLDTRVRIDPSLTVRGTEIQAENDLGLDNAQLLPLAEITLLPGERHLLRLNGLSARRSAQKVLSQRIVFDNEVYLRGERIDSELNLTMFGLTYGYRLLRHPRAELAATFGIQFTEVEANAVARSRVVREPESGIAPLPQLGLEGHFDFDERWTAEARLQYLSADLEDIDGSMLDARLALTWRHNPHLVFGAGYRAFSIEVDSRNDSLPGRVDASIDGPMLFLRASL
jgi:hypothetical protein